MNSESSALLEQLRDIHAAPQAPWWPPAPGWWLLALLVAAGVFLLVRRGLRAWQVRRRRRMLLRALDSISERFDPRDRPQDYVAALNALLKVVALRAFPDQACARMQGDDWYRFVAGQLPGGEAPDALEPLARGPYQPDPHFDRGALERAARRWILAHG